MDLKGKKKKVEKKLEEIQCPTTGCTPRYFRTCLELDNVLLIICASIREYLGNIQSNVSVICRVDMYIESSTKETDNVTVRRRQIQKDG